MKYQNPLEIPSSYAENNLGETLYNQVMLLRPKKIIEFGVLGGYSTICMAMALDELGSGKIYGYDLWEEYPYRHTTRLEAHANIKMYELEKYVELHYADFETWMPEECDLLVVDISNTGETIRRLKKIKEYLKCQIIFEGGTKERDEVAWMKKYNKEPIRESGVAYNVLNSKFPSISICS